MVRVYLDNIRRSDSVDWGSDTVIRIRTEGHSGFGTKGNDPVCAGISAIIQTGILGITKAARVRQKITQRDGYIESVIPVNGLDEVSVQALKVIIHTIIAGLEEIITSYPGHLEIHYTIDGETGGAVPLNSK